jgi:hypothetical protein
MTCGAERSEIAGMIQLPDGDLDDIGILLELDENTELDG